MYVAVHVDAKIRSGYTRRDPRLFLASRLHILLKPTAGLVR
jgi:hypothetical protein